MVPLYLRQLSAPAHLPVTSAHVPKYPCRGSLPPVYSRAHFREILILGTLSLPRPFSVNRTVLLLFPFQVFFISGYILCKNPEFVNTLRRPRSSKRRYYCSVFAAHPLQPPQFCPCRRSSPIRSSAYETEHTACAEMPSWLPVNPSPSSVVALIFT